MKNILALIIALTASNTWAAGSNYVESSIHGLTFSHPAEVIVTNYTNYGEFEMEVISIKTTNSFNIGLYIFTNSVSESTARNVAAICARAHGGNATSNRVDLYILETERNGTAFHSNFPDTKLSSELFIFEESGIWFVFNFVLDPQQNCGIRNTIINSMKFDKELSQQSGAGYPPQGVGSPDP